MADNKINITVSANTRKNITVSSAQQSAEITASTDTGRFWAQTSKNWAVSDVIVDNTDYSSKHYAQEAKTSAQNASNYEVSTRESYNSFLETSANAVTEIQGVKEETLTEIDNSKTNAVDSINTVKNSAIDSINSTKTTILNDIEFVADGEKEEIEELADVIKDNANTVNTAIKAGVERLNSIDALKNNQLTNCILEIPQRIKYTLENGTLTLKAGSQVIVPYGTTNENFTRVGNPTIVDGVVSGFSETSYIQKTLETPLTQDDNFKINLSFTTSSVNTLQQIVSFAGKYLTRPRLQIITNATLAFVYLTSSGTEKIASLGSVTQNTRYNLEIISRNGNLQILMNGTEKLNTNDFSCNITGLYSVYVSNWFTGSIDLKQFSITVDDEVVYRPYIQKGDRFLNDNFKVADTQFEDGKFFVWAEVQSDIVITANASMGNGLYTLAIRPQLNSISARIASTQQGSGDGSNLKSNDMYYHTVNNAITQYLNNVNEDINCSFPIFLVNKTDTGFTSIDQVFNGFGYIGSTVWVDKGVKGLIPNGRNEDGSLNNREFTVSSILTFSYNYTGTAKLMLKENYIRYAGTNVYSYNADENIAYDAGNKIYECNVGEVEVSSGVITSFNPKQPFRAVDQQDVIEKTTKKTLTMTGMSDTYCQQRIVNGDYGVMFRQDATSFYILITDSGNQYGTWNSLRPFNFNLSTGKIGSDCVNRVVVETYVSGTSWYRIWSDGWKEQGGRATKPSGTGVVYNLLKKFSNTNYCIIGIDVGNTNANIEVAFGSLTVSTFKIFNNGQHNISWYACGY